jgi:hydroxyacylglutathione hydrolase
VVRVIPIDTPSLGDRSYLVHDGDVGFVVDPQRDIDRVLALAEAERVTIRSVFETHVHNDYVTGGYALAARTGADYYVNGDDPVTFTRVPVADGDVIQAAGHLRVRAVATPGHTYTHLSYALDDDGDVAGVFTGGSLLFGAVGRPDLLGVADTVPLARCQHASANRLASLLADTTVVYPTHGFGSFCASGGGAERTSSTIGMERHRNPALRQGEPEFVDELLAGLDAWPAYYAHMGERNRSGPAAPDLSPPRRADAEELRKRLHAGEWIVDLRHRVAFAEGHVAGTLNFGMDGGFGTYLGWLIPWGTPLTLLGDGPDEVAQAQRELARIGIDRPAAHATGPAERWAGGRQLERFRLATFADLAALIGRPLGPERPRAGGMDADVVVLDVRRDLERADRHIPGSVHIPLHELPGRRSEVPGGEIWVHCGAGYRASIAASLLAAGGRRVVAIDDDFDNAADAGLL